MDSLEVTLLVTDGEETLFAFTARNCLLVRVLLLKELIVSLQIENSEKL
jgi:hypothetical protein